MSKKIFIDAGHGGKDPGATNGNRKEKDDTLRLSLLVAEKFRSFDTEVLFSRTEDKDITINERCKLANDAGADVFLSIHRNSASASATGNEIWIYSGSNAASVSRAQRILQAICKADGLSNRGVKKGAPSYSDFGVNKNTNMPAMLMELGFISNNNNNNVFDSKIDAIASAICESVSAEFGVQRIVTQPVSSELYRIRTSKDDAKSQKGAFKNLQSAINCCQNAGEGYHVFDSQYNIVYSYKSPEVSISPQPEEPKGDVKEEPTIITAVYDLDYPIKTRIVNKDIETVEEINQDDCTKAIKYIKANNPSFDIEIAKAFFKLAPRYNIDPVMVISQSILETGWFKYSGSAVKPEHHNYCGLGVTSNGIEGGKFSTIEEGVTAQLQHLYAYGCKEDVPDNESIVDPRFKYVTRGIATYWQQLAGRWAVPGYDKNTYATPQLAMEAENTYGQKIQNIANTLRGISTTEEEINEYFNTHITPEVKPEVDNDRHTTESEEHTQDSNNVSVDKEKISLVWSIIEKIIKLIIELFTKK